jgi:hypothetical protein
MFDCGGMVFSEAGLHCDRKVRGFKLRYCRKIL